MRAIEKEMNAAIERRDNWKSDNTQVFIDSGTCAVWLFGNHIATVWQDGTVEVDEETLARWPTPTTVSRLRALGANVSIKAGVPYLNDQRVDKKAKA